MSKHLPRIASVERIGPAVVGLTWRNGQSDRVDLTGWIAMGGEILAPLQDTTVFATVRLGDYGASAEWGDESGDLAIDAHHLRQLADEQRQFGMVQIVDWQLEIDLSNREAAEFLGVSLSTWNAYKAGSSKVPPSIAMTCRAALRDPILLHAHYRPRKSGRPRRLDEPSAA